MLNFCWSTERKRTGLKKGQLCVNQWKALTVSLRTQKPITVNTTQTHPYKHTHKRLHFAVCSLRQFQADCYFQCFCRHCVWACLLLLRHAEQSKKAKTTQLSPHSGSIPLTFFHVEHFAPSITKQCVSGKKKLPNLLCKFKARRQRCARVSSWLLQQPLAYLARTSLRTLSATSNCPLSLALSLVQLWSMAARFDLTVLRQLSLKDCFLLSYFKRHSIIKIIIPCSYPVSLDSFFTNLFFYSKCPKQCHWILFAEDCPFPCQDNVNMISFTYLLAPMWIQSSNQMWFGVTGSLRMPRHVKLHLTFRSASVAISQ